MKSFKPFLLYAILSVSFYPAISLAQLITTDPPFPASDDLVVVTFDATEGNGGLAGYNGDVYAHTGVITSQSTSGSDWKYVKSGWGQNTPETKLTRMDNDLYALTITPNIRDYYGVPQNETILQMAFVFRSEDTQLTGRESDGGDIFVAVYTSELNVVFVKPDENGLIVEPGDSIPVEIAGNFSDTLSLFLDNVLLSETTGLSLTDTIFVIQSGLHWVKAVAKNDTGMVADSFYYYVRGPVIIADLPAGVRDGINYIDGNTVVLSLLAPGKEFVFAIGDFNNWTLSDESIMKMTPDGERFWIEIGGLVPQQEYVFQYFVDGEIRIADPYTNKTSDPWNDKGIPESVYPGLIDYPETKTSGMASVLQTGQTPYEWEVENFIPVETEKLVIYEMLIRDYTEEHTYQSITGKLDYLDSLGITALELMPVNEFEGNSSWGYNPSFYFAPDKFYGPENDLKKLVDECHKRGIAVFIDMVLNHSYDQSPFVQLYFDGQKPTEDNPWYNREHNFTNPDAQWGNDFNHESPYTQALVDSINSYWMSEYKIDGFRFDFTKGFGNNIKGSNDPWGSNYDADRIALLKRMADEIWKRNPDAYIILEHLAVNQEDKELADYGMLMWGNLNYNYSEASMGYHSGSNSDFSWISYVKRGWQYPHVVGYMESHDEERVMFKNITYGNSEGDYNIQDTVTGLGRIGLVSAFFYTVPGPKMIWQFGELGYDYSINYNGRLGEKPVRWDYLSNPYRKYLYNLVSALISLRNEYDVFSTNDFSMSVSGALKSMHLNHSGMNVCIIGNFSVQEGSIIPGFQHTGTWYDYLTGQPYSITTNAAMDLLPGEFHIFTDVELPTPQIGTGVEPTTASLGYDPLISVFPNPSDGMFFMNAFIINHPDARITIYDCRGNAVYCKHLYGLGKGENIIPLHLNNNLPKGLYLLEFSNGNTYGVRKISLL